MIVEGRPCHTTDRLDYPRSCRNCHRMSCLPIMSRVTIQIRTSLRREFRDCLRRLRRGILPRLQQWLILVLCGT